MTDKIRIFTRQDYPRILDIYNQAVVQHMYTADLDIQKPEDKRSWFESHNQHEYPIYIFEEDNQVIGWCAITPYRKGRRALKHTAEISYYVDFNHHGHGVATTLIDYALSDCERIKKKVLLAILLERNLASIKLLEKFGFSEWAYLPKVAKIGKSLVGQKIFGKELFS